MPTTALHLCRDDQIGILHLGGTWTFDAAPSAGQAVALPGHSGSERGGEREGNPEVSLIVY
ncbi:hypothetical protein GCM10011579_084260 [Streptomyces albiflavescens]|uniref:Uncharacterized protein n=1 Tax=Streptomyces albiflavescens TaxID=1623582 RepID=A0A918D9E8_9ACTN|nr:hypothetical protein GCM10011579_084260 [Streptomyces albiflavescens]